MIIQKNPEILATVIGDEILLMHPTRGEYYQMNRVGARFWTLLDGIRDFDLLIDRVQEEFDVDRDRVRADLWRLVADLQRQDLIQVQGAALT